MYAHVCTYICVHMVNSTRHWQQPAATSTEVMLRSDDRHDDDGLHWNRRVRVHPLVLTCAPISLALVRLIRKYNMYVRILCLSIPDVCEHEY